MKMKPISKKELEELREKKLKQIREGKIIRKGFKGKECKCLNCKCNDNDTESIQ
jgi:hypothetical protein